MTLEGVETSRHTASFVLVASPTCGYCLTSAPFHKRAIKAASAAAVPFYVVVPSRKHSLEYLKLLGVPIAAVKEWKELHGQVSGTPTLIGADATGVVRQLWLGGVRSEQEQEILKIIETSTFAMSASPGKARDADESEITCQDLQRLHDSHQAQVIDIRERELQNPELRNSDVISMPLFEMAVRVPFELEKTMLQVVDCTNIDQALCTKAAQRLKEMGFRVTKTGGQSFHQSCSLTQRPLRSVR